MQIIIDRARCIGSGDCVVAAPSLFDQGDDGVAVVVSLPDTAELADLAREAIENCPSGALAAEAEVPR